MSCPAFRLSKRRASDSTMFEIKWTSLTQCPQCKLRSDSLTPDLSKEIGQGLTMATSLLCMLMAFES